MTEQECIASEHAKHERRLARQLRTVQRTGWTTRQWIETLWSAGLIQFGGPSETNHYNHYRLTPKGFERLS